MIVPKSSHDRFCLKKSSPNARSTILISESAKDLSNPKDDNTKDDAMVGVYPLECPKPILPLKKIGKSRNPTPNPTPEKTSKSKKMSFPERQKSLLRNS